MCTCIFYKRYGCMLLCMWMLFLLYPYVGVYCLEGLGILTLNWPISMVLHLAGWIAHRGSIMPQFCTQCNVKNFEETMGIAYLDSLTPTKNIQNVPIEQVLEIQKAYGKVFGRENNVNYIRACLDTLHNNFMCSITSSLSLQHSWDRCAINTLQIHCNKQTKIAHNATNEWKCKELGCTMKNYEGGSMDDVVLVLVESHKS